MTVFKDAPHFRGVQTGFGGVGLNPGHTVGAFLHTEQTAATSTDIQIACLILIDGSENQAQCSATVHLVIHRLQLAILITQNTVHTEYQHLTVGLGKAHRGP